MFVRTLPLSNYQESNPIGFLGPLLHLTFSDELSHLIYNEPKQTKDTNEMKHSK